MKKWVLLVGIVFSVPMLSMEYVELELLSYPVRFADGVVRNISKSEMQLICSHSSVVDAIVKKSPDSILDLNCLSADFDCVLQFLRGEFVNPSKTLAGCAQYLNVLESYKASIHPEYFEKKSSCTVTEGDDLFWPGSMVRLLNIKSGAQSIHHTTFRVNQSNNLEPVFDKEDSSDVHPHNASLECVAFALHPPGFFRGYGDGFLSAPNFSIQTGLKNVEAIALDREGAYVAVSDIYFAEHSNTVKVFQGSDGKHVATFAQQHDPALYDAVSAMGIVGKKKQIILVRKSSGIGVYPISGGDALAKVSWNDVGIQEKQAIIFSLAVQPQERWFATASYWGELRFWDIKTLACLVLFKSNEAIFSLRSIALSPDGMKMAILSRNDYLDKRELIIMRLADA